MKKHILLWEITLLGCLLVSRVNGQTITTADVKTELAKYPIVKSNLCTDCYLWVNPYYKSIADVKKHYPVIDYEAYTKAGADSADKATFGRTGIFAAWHSVTGQPNEDDVYTAANKAIKAINSKDEIAKGHVQAWVLNRASQWKCIFSDIYTFNAAHEHQGQNVGTEIATENLTRLLLKTNDTVRVWGGCCGSQKTYTDGKVTDTEPDHYWKIIKYSSNTLCYWMPNLMTETQAMLPKRVVTYQQLVTNLGFDPEKVLN